MYRASVDIGALPEQVFSFMTDPGRLRQWQPDVGESYPLPEGGLCVGAVLRATVQEYGRRFEVQLRVTSLVRNQHVAYEMEAPMASVRSEFRLTRAGDKTRVEHLVTLKPKGFGRLLLPLMPGMIRRKLQSRLELLRRALETEAASRQAAG